MFWHNFKYSILVMLRDKQQLFWSLIFVVILGTLFQVTFGNAYDSDENAHDFSVAVYIEDEKISEIFDRVIAEISIDNSGEKLLDITYVNGMEEAEGLLDDKSVRGIFFSENGELKLMLRPVGMNQGSMDIQDGILASVVTDYHRISTIIYSVSKNQKLNNEDLIKYLYNDRDNNHEVKISDSSMDVYTEYFYNLIAMGCLFASFAGVTIAIKSQSNLSAVAVRKNVALSNAFVSTTAALLASLLLLYMCVIAAMIYLTMIGVDFGDKLWQMALLVLIGTLNGISLGFLIGSIGKLDENIKIGFAVGISLVLCFFSGLMIADMKFIIMEKIPLFNKINPAALISDSFYALNVYQTNTQYIINIVTLLVISIVFMLGGILVGRRKKYASL